MVFNLAILESEFPNFVGSSLHTFLLSTGFNLCDKITFCACSWDEYTVERDLACNYSIKIGENSEETCQPIWTNIIRPGIETIACRDVDKDYYWYSIIDTFTAFHAGYQLRSIRRGDAFAPVVELIKEKCGSLPTPSPSVVANTENLEVSNKKYITDTSNFEVLKDFGIEFVNNIEDSYVAPYGVVHVGGSSNSIYDVSFGQEEVIKSDAGGISKLAMKRYDQDDQDQLIEIIVDSIAQNSYMLSLFDDTVYHDQHWSSISLLDINYCSIQGNSFILGGLFKDAIKRDTTTLFTATDTTQFFATFSASGIMTAFHTIEGVQSENAFVGSSQPGRHAFMAKAKGSTITINGVPEPVVQGQHQLLNIEAQSVTLERSFAIPTTLSVMGIAKDNDRNIAIALYGESNLQYLTLPPGLHIVMLNEQTTTIQISTYDITGVDITKFDIEFFRYFEAGRTPSLLTGITFSNTANLDGNLITSEGGSDVLILQTALDGSLQDYWHYGTGENENVSRILGSDYQVEGSDYIFFGGEFSSKIFQRQLGDLTFINTNLGVQKAYVTYIKREATAAQATYAQVDTLVPQLLPTGKELRQKPTLHTYPNPSKDAFRIEYSYAEASQIQISLHDSFGRELETYATSLENGRINFPSKFPDGIADGLYFIVVKDDHGNTITRKIIKQSSATFGKEDD